MKNIKGYSEYIKEYFNRMHNNMPTRSEELPENKFWHLFKNNCNNFDPDNTFLWRGARNTGDFIFMDPTKFKRGSIERIDVHTFFIDYLPDWSEYPNRSGSIIASTSRSEAGSFGNSRYFIIPYDNVPIVICPEKDIWQSIEHGEVIAHYNEFSGDEMTDYGSDSFFKLFDSFLNDIGVPIGMDGRKEFSFSFDEFKHFILNDFNPKTNSSQKSAIIRNERIFNLIKSHIFISKPEDLTGEILLRFISDVFNPEYNDFKLEEYKKGFSVEDADVYGGKAVWIGGPCLMVEERIYLDFLNKLK